MKKVAYLSLTAVLGLSVSVLTTQAAQIWDIANNSVTDSRSITFNTPGTATISDILQFSSDAAVAAGEASGTYILTSVVITISGSSMSGTFQFNNTYGTAGTITSASYAAGQGLTFSAAGATVIQTMTHTFNGGNVYQMTGYENKSETFSPTMGAMGSTTVTTGLDAFTGSGYLASSSANLSAQMSSSTDAGIFSGSLANGTANLSITYYYNVPEPNTLALLGLGCAILGMRRRRPAK
jgi:hypothetical protein